MTIKPLGDRVVIKNLEAQEKRIADEKAADEANQKAADKVADMIKALTDDSTEEEVAAARTAYDALV